MKIRISTPGLGNCRRDGLDGGHTGKNSKEPCWAGILMSLIITLTPNWKVSRGAKVIIIFLRSEILGLSRVLGVGEKLSIQSSLHFLAQMAKIYYPRDLEYLAPFAFSQEGRIRRLLF